MAAADAALESARDVTSDTNLLAEVRTAINGYVGAEGSDLTVDGKKIIALRKAIADELDVKEVKVDDVNDVAFALFTSAQLLKALSGDNADGKVTQPKAPTASEFEGQGTWVKGAAGKEPGDFEFTYQPTPAEQYLLTALSKVEDRQKLIKAEEQTEAAFEKAAIDGQKLGAQLSAIEERLAELADAEQDVIDAQTDLDDDNGLIDALETALAAKAEAEDWFTDNGYDVPELVNGAEAGTAANDVFLLGDANGTITGFALTATDDDGVVTGDTLFVGSEFSLVTAGKEKTIKDNLGDVSLLEVIAIDNGTDTVLYFEGKTFAGNNANADDMAAVITLAGVTNATLALNDGFLTIA
jgi:hypothetical protein